MDHVTGSVIGKKFLVFCDESVLVWVYCLIPLFDWSDLRHVTPQ